MAMLLMGMFVFSGSLYARFERFLISTFPSDNVLLARVIQIHEEHGQINGTVQWFQEIDLEFLSGSVEGEETVVHSKGLVGADDAQKLSIGETVIVARNTDLDGDAYYITDRYRLPMLVLGFLIFAVAVILFGKWRGLTSFLGLMVSILILVLYVVPQILAGSDPLFVSLVGSAVIAFTSLYLAHGFSARTTIALVGTISTIVIAVLLTVVFVDALQLLGISTEESFVLRYEIEAINLQGILLAGIIIGMLGVLDDVTIGQAATISEIKKANPALKFKELYTHGISVGREHIASLVNTLVMAYAGAALPLFLLIVIQSGDVPVWLAINGEPIAEEIARSLIGSVALILAVPITTFLAAYYYDKYAN